MRQQSDKIIQDTKLKNDKLRQTIEKNIKVFVLALRCCLRISSSGDSLDSFGNSSDPANWNPNMCAMVKSRCIGDGKPPTFNRQFTVTSCLDSPQERLSQRFINLNWISFQRRPVCWRDGSLSRHRRIAPTEVYCECAECTNTSLRFLHWSHISNRLIFVFSFNCICQGPAVLMNKCQQC